MGKIVKRPEKIVKRPEKDDTVLIRRGPLKGTTVRLQRHDATNQAWYCVILADKKNTKDGHKILVYDWELSESPKNANLETKPCK